MRMPSTAASSFLCRQRCVLGQEGGRGEGTRGPLLAAVCPSLFKIPMPSALCPNLVPRGEQLTQPAAVHALRCQLPFIRQRPLCAVPYKPPSPSRSEQLTKPGAEPRACSSLLFQNALCPVPSPCTAG